MKRLSHIFATVILLTIVGTFIVPAFVSAQQQQRPYELLVPLPGEGRMITHVTNFSTYVIFMFQLLIGVAVALAVIMITIGGIQYMTSELPGGKSDGKEKITQALWGLALAAGAYLILYTIDPNILNSDFTTTPVSDIDNRGATPQNPRNPIGNPSSPTTNRPSDANVIRDEFGNIPGAVVPAGNNGGGGGGSVDDFLNSQ